ncbi:hypothetical protein [Paenibacillus sp. FSL L8-0463]|uniref:hypothetical protein n=1 Tax=Paenibacillus sp. FSL L8-0463 TaxID=2954687 RepID=UPI00311A6E93
MSGIFKGLAGGKHSFPPRPIDVERMGAFKEQHPCNEAVIARLTITVLAVQGSARRAGYAALARQGSVWLAKMTDTLRLRMLRMKTTRSQLGCCGCRCAGHQLLLIFWVGLLPMGQQAAYRSVWIGA